MNSHIDFFDRLVVRCPVFSVVDIPDSNDFFDNLANEQIFLNALYLANPEVYQLTQRVLQGAITDEQKVGKIKDTILNYYLRMCTNSTPFGFFAEISTLKWNIGGDSSVILGKTKPYVRLDMSALEKLFDYLQSIPPIFNQSKLYPNNTIYKVENQYRYIENIKSEASTEYTISSVDSSEILTSIFHFINPGRTYVELVDYLLQNGYEGYSTEDLRTFIEEMIDAKLLITELQLNLTGVDPFTKINNFVKSLLSQRQVDETKEFFYLIENIIRNANANPYNIALYSSQLFNLFAAFDIHLDKKAIFQVDLHNSGNDNYLSFKIQDELRNALKTLSYFEQPIYKLKLEEFKKQFLNRYEGMAVPLLHILDADLGIGFGKFKFRSNNLLLDEAIILKGSPNLPPGSYHNAAKSMLATKIIKTISADEYTVQLSEKDFKNIEPQDYEFSPTFQIMFNVLDKESNLIELHTAGHTSAASLLGRFGNGDDTIKEILAQIAELEDNFHENAIVAEIIHIPDARIANLSYRPDVRNYEIPVLNLSISGEEQQILLDDLFVTVSNNRIVLLSKKHKKEVIPKLTTAHNYNKNSNPVYQFLAELQYQDIVPSVSLKLDDLSFAGNFIPRIQVGQVILSKAKWTFSSAEIINFFSPNYDVNKLNEFRSQWKMPRYVHYLKNNKEVFLDWNNQLLIYALAKFIQTCGKVTFIEYPFAGESPLILNGENRPLLNQFIACAINRSATKRNCGKAYINKLFDEHKPQSKFFPGSSWVYFKIYCGITFSDKLMIEYLDNELGGNYRSRILRKFFFIRYNDPEYHLRWRFECPNSRRVPELICKINTFLRPFAENNLIWNITIETYSRELPRYENQHIYFAESVFEKSSLFWLNYLKISNSQSDYYLPIVFLCSLNSILKGLGIQTDKKLEIISKLKNAYELEFVYFGETDHPIPWQTDHLNCWRKDAANAVEAFTKIVI